LAGAEFAAEQRRRDRRQRDDGGRDLEPGLAGLAGGAGSERGVEERREDRGEQRVLAAQGSPD